MTVEWIWPPRTAKKAETVPPAFELRREDNRDAARSQVRMCFRSLSGAIRKGFTDVDQILGAHSALTAFNCIGARAATRLRQVVSRRMSAFIDHLRASPPRTSCIRAADPTSMPGRPE